MSVRDREWAVLDLEATGLDTENEKIVSVGVILLDADLVETERWSSRINPGIPMRASEIHGLSDESVAEAPSFKEIASELASKLAGRVLTTHNTRYDARLLAAEYRRVGINPNPAGVVCTLVWARRAFPEAGAWSLAALAAQLGIEQVAAHSAEDDTHVLAQILPHLLRSGIEPVADAWGRVGELPRRFGNAKIERVPVEWINPGALSPGGVLVQGMRVVFTGGDDAERIHLGRAAQEAGLDVVEWVAASTSVLVADPPVGNQSSKATKAAKLGIPIVGPEEFRALLSSVAAGSLPDPDAPAPARAVKPRRLPRHAPVSAS